MVENSLNQVREEDIREFRIGSLKVQLSDDAPWSSKFAYFVRCKGSDPVWGRCLRSRLFFSSGILRRLVTLSSTISRATSWRGPKDAGTATARKLAELCGAVWTERRNYEERA